MTPEQFNASFQSVYERFGSIDTIRAKPPLLAHYTTVDTLEKILTTEELWFSNPLIMNDLNEMRFGILNGVELFNTSQKVRDAVGNPNRANILLESSSSSYPKALTV